ncbi:MAG: hypothetical protein A2475_07190 [Ignavibacteria bacterium RIFOXYC2_FULL_35_21]|nr:MAG: hypothetical protein A2X63_06280 [Ignavibacteria bacterium GWA2_35_8]OGU96444.1 MAG: hypothetical protein A2220_05365 [Ignavibacteria bacterium RIFOXYA2_FULL_35_10]OGV23877.1 MAG: hypothetical protein A2475_07190 [Ignavibacteria bacterium RIFOXYC2_FULL_35_21]
MNTIKISRLTESTKIGNMLVGMLVIGSIWGLLDAITVIYISPLFHMRKLCLCPLSVVVYGFTLMSIALVIYRKPLMLIGIGIIAASFKLLDFIFIPLPVINNHINYQPVVNPALAAITVAIIYALFSGILLNKLENNKFMLILIGTVSGFINTIAFTYIAFYVVQTPPLIVESPLQFIFPFHAPMSALLGAFFLPFGFWLESRLHNKISILQTKKVSLYYIGSGAIVTFSLLACIIILITR